jgi:hypothetical protein
MHYLNARNRLPSASLVLSAQTHIADGLILRLLPLPKVALF